MLIVVVMATRIAPSRSAFCAALGQVRTGVGGAAEELELRRNLRQHDLPVDRHGGDRHDRADDVDPAGHPRREPGRELL
jgi:hypothetical protein